jgi:hypothetical protein
LEHTKREEECRALVDALSSPAAGRDDVYTAMVRLREIGSEAVPRLLQVVSDGGLQPGARARAIELLGTLAGPAAVPTLTALLRAPAVQVRWAAATVLGRIGDRAAVPALLGAQADHSECEVSPGLLLRVSDAASSSLRLLERAGEADRSPAAGRLSRRARVRLALIVVSAIAAGGAAGAGVSAGLWSPVVAVSLAVAIGLAAGLLVLRSARRTRRESRHGL